MFRYKPVGWRNESYRHYLAAKYGYAAKRWSPLGRPKASEPGREEELKELAESIPVPKELQEPVPVSKRLDAKLEIGAVVEASKERMLPRPKPGMVRVLRLRVKRTGKRPEKDPYDFVRMKLAAMRKASEEEAREAGAMASFLEKPAEGEKGEEDEDDEDEEIYMVRKGFFAVRAVEGEYRQMRLKARAEVQTLPDDAVDAEIEVTERRIAQAERLAKGIRGMREAEQASGILAEAAVEREMELSRQQMELLEYRLALAERKGVQEKGYYAAKRVFKKGKFHVTKSGGEVKHLAEKVDEAIRPYVHRSEIAGSLRRRIENPVDIDIVAVPIPWKKDDLRAFLRGRSSKVYQDGEQKFSGRIEGVKVEVAFSKPEEFGAQLLTVTGSGPHNIGLRKLAKGQGLKLSQHGLYKGKVRIAGKTEQEIYRKLGRPVFKKPWERS